MWRSFRPRKAQAGRFRFARCSRLYTQSRNEARASTECSGHVVDNDPFFGELAHGLDS